MGRCLESEITYILDGNVFARLQVCAKQNGAKGTGTDLIRLVCRGIPFGL